MLFPIAPVGTRSLTAGSFDVRGFGATGDGKTLDTAAINNAIDAAADAGGATVLFPAGNYLSYSIHLKSNVTLHLESGATIVAADAPAAGARVRLQFERLLGDAPILTARKTNVEGVKDE